MSSRVFVGGLAWETTGDTLRQAFEQFGTVTQSVVVQDRETGRSRGFGFVTFEEEASAKDAVQKMVDQEVDGRPVRVDIANERPPRGEGGGYRSGGRYDNNRNGGGGGGGYGGRYGDNRSGGRYGDRDGGYGGGKSYGGGRSNYGERSYGNRDGGRSSGYGGGNDGGRSDRGGYQERDGGRSGDRDEKNYRD